MAGFTAFPERGPGRDAPLMEGPNVRKARYALSATRS